MHDMMLNEFEVAALLKVSISTVRRWRRVGEGPKFHRIGTKMVRYHRSAISEYIERTLVEPKVKEETVEAAG